MKKLILLLMSLLVIGMVSAIEQPVDNVLLATIDQPIAPGTGTEGECTPYEITGRTCEGDVSHYEQCTQSVSGGTWKHFSTNCAQYEKVCNMGKCINPEDAGLFGLDYKTIGIIVLIVFIIILISKGRK